MLYCAAGDSGGPLLIPDIRLDNLELGNAYFDQIVGIISFGDDCSKGVNGASIHTQVNRFIPWIKKVIENPTYNIQVMMDGNFA